MLTSVFTVVGPNTTETLHNDKGINTKRNITIVNIYTPNREPKYIKQILTYIKGEIDSNTIILWNFNMPIASWTNQADRKSKRKHLFHLK